MDTSRTTGAIDLTRFALGQGGLSDDPMIPDRIDPIAQLRPQTIHVFLQEYFDIDPAHHRYNCEKLDKTIDAIRATRAASRQHLFQTFDMGSPAGIKISAETDRSELKYRLGHLSVHHIYQDQALFLDVIRQQFIRQQIAGRPGRPCPRADWRRSRPKSRTVISRSCH